MWHLARIPKVAHFYWGNDTISFLRYLSVYSFKKYNPDWHIRLYYPKIRYRGEKTWSSQEQTGKFSGPNYLERLFAMSIEKVEVDFSHHGMDNYMPETFKADFLRWYLLANVGGLWSDIDIIYFRPLDDFYLNNQTDRDLDTLICFHSDDTGVYHSIGFLLSSPNNPYYRFINSQSYGMLDKGNYQSIGSGILNHYFPEITLIQQRFPGLNLGNIGAEVVYPLNYTMVPYIFHTPYTFYLTEKSIGLHWFAGHPEAVIFENLIDENTHVGYNNIISQLVRQVIWS
ncbi:MAG: hypothetical protein ACM3X9_02995 [Bacillota bacterium]